MVEIRHARLMVVVALIGLCKADNDSDIAMQAMVQDNKGNEIRIVTTIRDTSWPSSIIYNPNAYYELLPDFYKDKISVREVVLGTMDYFFSLFNSAIPRQWHVASDKVTVHHLDLFDALTIGVQDANVDIVQAALAKLPYSKSVLASGKSTDFMNNQAFTIDGKFRIDQFIELACDSMATRINTQREVKFAALSFTTAIGTTQLARVVKDILAWPAAVATHVHGILTSGLGKTLEDSANLSSEDYAPGKSKIDYVLMAAGTIVAILAHRMQHTYVEGYIKVLDLLVSAEGVMFDHNVTYKKMSALKQKIQWFGKSNEKAKCLQLVLNKL